MKGKVAIVTGANGGLGRHVTQQLLDAGVSVVGVSRKIANSDFDGSAFTPLPADISTADGAQSMTKAIIAKFGRVDIVAHTVGGFAGGHPLHETDDEVFENMLNMNLTSTFFLLRALIPELRKTGQGRLIGIGSRAALEPGAGVGAYSASKAAMVSLIRTAAAENADAGMTANVILPGTIDTPANRKSMPNADFSKWVQPSRIASLVVWLAGDSGRDVNGAVIPVYGGGL